MQYLGKIEKDADLVNKKYVDDEVGKKYTKPSGGIPKTDLASAVQTSLGLADTAIQDVSGKQDKITESNKLPYSLLSGTPTIPTVNNATLTIQKNGTNVQTFTANQSTNATANITVPTKVSELTNDSGYLTSSSSISPQAISSGYLQSRIYINTHPENSGSLIPFINNDWAYLLERGGSCTPYTTTSTDYTAQTLSVKKSYTANNNWFDGSSSYGNFSVDSKTEVMIIDITPPEILSYSNLLYIDFGSTSWQAKDIQIYAWNNSSENIEQTYRRLGGVTNQNNGHWFLSTSYTWYKDSAKATVGGYGANRFRFVLTNWQGTSPRIAQIGLIYYGSSQQRMTTMSRGIDDSVWRNITPAKNNTYNLGSSTNKWNTVYATTFNGNATSATTVNGHTVNSDVPADAKFTDTTYSSKTASSGGTEVSLVTTGEKYTWNNKYSKPSGGIPKTDLASAVQASLNLADSALQSAPVTSVNGQTGAVTLDLPDVSEYVRASDAGSATDPNLINANTLGGHSASDFLLASQATDFLEPTDVINNLTSTSAVKPLSAAQGKILNDNANTLSQALDAKAPLHNPHFTGVVQGTQNTGYTTPQFRNIVFSTEEPTSATQGENGTIWFVYEVE